MVGLGLYSTVFTHETGFVNAIDDLLTRNPKYPLTTGYIRCYARGESNYSFSQATV